MPWLTMDVVPIKDTVARKRVCPAGSRSASELGGATDWSAVLGESKAERIIRQRGRWDSDIHKIYERAVAAEHLSGSALVGSASGAELEALCAGWVQPASFR